MANKRMISADIVTSDAFITMRLEAQALYVQCIINADDDGLIDNMKSVLRSLGLRNPSLQELLKNNFLYDLKDGIYCVKHWWINNNNINPDRKKNTKYPEKLKLLKIKENRAYTWNLEPLGELQILATDCNQVGNNMATDCNQVGNSLAPVWQRRLD